MANEVYTRSNQALFFCAPGDESWAEACRVSGSQTR